VLGDVIKTRVVDLFRAGLSQHHFMARLRKAFDKGPIVPEVESVGYEKEELQGGPHRPLRVDGCATNWIALPPYAPLTLGGATLTSFQSSEPESRIVALKLVAAALHSDMV
jgi:hypothetical protein